MRAGRIDAIVTWQADRLLRTVEDASAIVTIAKSFGTVIANVQGTIDLSTASGRKRLRPGRGRRVRRPALGRLRLKHAELAAEGKWEGGMRNFGYDLEPYPDLASGRVKWLVLNPTEAQALEAAAKEVIAGRSPPRHCLEQAGLTTTQVAVHTPEGQGPAAQSQDRRAALCRRQARHRRLAGHHHPGSAPGVAGHPGTNQPGAPGHGLPTTRTYLLGGLVRCGRCGHRLWQAPRQTPLLVRHAGGCGGLLRVAEPLERHVVWHLLSRLPERLLGAAKRAPEEWATLGRLMTQRQTQEDRLEELADYLADGTLDRGEYLRQKSCKPAWPT